MRMAGDAQKMSGVEGSWDLPAAIPGVAGQPG